MIILENNLRQNLIKIYTKTHQVVPVFKIFWGVCPQTLLASIQLYYYLVINNIYKKLDHNIHQNTPNCTSLKYFLLEVCPEIPLKSQWICHAHHAASRPANLSKKSSCPPLF